MAAVFRYRHRDVSAEEVQFLRALIAAHPGASRWRLSGMVCKAWNWRQENGVLRDQLCRSLMLELHRAGLIELPPVRRQVVNRLIQRRPPQPVEVDRTPIRTTLRELRSRAPLQFYQVRRTAQERQFDWLMASEHYLGFSRPVGEYLKFMVFSGMQPVALFAWSSAPRHLGPRDRYIGWTKEQRLKGIRYVAYNTRYLIPRWIEVPHLASHLLSRMTRMLSQEWQMVYAHPLYFTETFVDPALHRGSCYRAANWVDMGRTLGLGKDSRNNIPNRSLKDVLGLALTPDFRERLCS